MQRYIRQVLVAALCAAGFAWASPVDDFRRGSSIQLQGVAGNYVARVLGSDIQRGGSSSDATECVSKAPGSLDVDIPFNLLGIAATGHFTGVQVDATTVRLSINQSFNSCVSIQGSSRKLRRVTGQLTIRLDALADPTPDVCAADFAANARTIDDPTDVLVFAGTSGCTGGVDFDVRVTELDVRALVGKHVPEPPVRVARLALEDEDLCAPPSDMLNVNGELRLQNDAPRAGATFSLVSDNPQVTLSPSTLHFDRDQMRKTFRATVPAGFSGTARVTATDAAHGATASTYLRVGQSSPIPGGQCNNFSRLVARNDLLGVCLACDFNVRLRLGMPARLVAQNSKGRAYQSAMSRSGAAGYSTLGGSLVGYLVDANGVKTASYADVAFVDRNDDGLAVGAVVDSKNPFGVPVAVMNKSKVMLPTPAGIGVADNVANDGSIGGWVASKQNVVMAALWLGGQLKLVHPAQAAWSRVASLSDDGLAVIQALDSKGNAFSVTYEVKTGYSKVVMPPSGYEGVELVGGTMQGLRAGHYIQNGQKVPFIDFGGGPRLLGSFSSGGFDVVEIRSVDASGRMLTKARDMQGVLSTKLFEVEQ